MAKRPAEVFGYEPADKSKEAETARRRRWCPFTDLRCTKQSRLLKYPMGVCSVEFNGVAIAICPKRFLERRKAFEAVADTYFRTRSDLVVLAEVRLPPIGAFDYVMVKHSPMSTDVLDFAVVEFQTGQTTGTGKLVDGLKDVMHGVDVSKKSYAFGMNMYDIWKRSFTQILNKGIVLEAWKRKIFWAVQEQVFNDLVNRYRLGPMPYDASHSSVFSLYDMQPSPTGLHLVHRGMKSSTVDALFHAFSENPAVPDRERFETALRAKLEARMGFRI